MSSSKVKIFPDTNVLLGLILHEQRYWSSNLLFRLLVERHGLSCTILPTIEAEFHHKLDEIIDLIGDVNNDFVVNIVLRKTDPGDPMKVTTLAKTDVRSVEDSFAQTYQSAMNSAPDERERAKRRVAFDLVEAWIMDYWSQQLAEGKVIGIDDFLDSQRFRVSEGRRNLEDSFLGLKAKLNNVDCSWSEKSGLAAQISTIVDDPDDVKHLALAASYPDVVSVRTIYVTSDVHVMRAKVGLESNHHIVATRPAFAFANTL